MATIDDRVVTSNFTGLTSTAVTALIVLTIGITLEGILKRLRRYTEEDEARAKGDKNVRDRGMEGWAMGYLYRARTYVPFMPTEDYSKYPFVWIWRAIKLPQKFFELHTGEDATVYVRFVRGCFYWTLLQCCTVFPTVLSVNFIFSPENYATTSIDRASLSALVSSPSGQHLLWVHVVCLWFLSLTWIMTLAWIGYGAVRIRRNALRRLLQQEADQSVAAESEKSEKVVRPASEGLQAELPLAMELERQLLAGPVEQGRHLGVDSKRDVGWRHRTVLMRNIPEAMRSEKAIAEYFEEYLLESPLTETEPPSAPSTPTTPIKRLPKSLSPHAAATDDALITKIVLVRKQYELNETFNKYRETQYQLETAHSTLAENVVDWARRKRKSKAAAKDGDVHTSGTAHSAGIGRFFRRKKEVVNEDLEREAREGDDFLLAALGPWLEKTDPVDSETGEPLSIWVVLEKIPPKLLDRFQPLFKLKHFRGQAVPAIDYYLAKLNLLAVLLEDKRADPEKFEPASSAFVTFKTAKLARRARMELKQKPGSKMFGTTGSGLGVFECKVGKAPEVRDLDWNRLVLVSLSSDIVRGALLQILIWAATIFWVIPLSFLVGLLSLEKISKYIPKLATYLEAHSVTNSLFSNLLPTAIVAILGMLVPTLIGMLTRNGQTFLSVSRLHAAVQARYWKWLLVNIVLVFCVGMSAFTAFLNAFRQPTSILPVVAAAFPKGATFFVSWLLLTIGMHHGIEHCLFGIPFINHGTIRKLKAPRKREELALPRSFSYFYWVPNHLLVMAVTAIFAILNPLVIAFSLAYFTFALIVFKNQFAHVYWRRWYELGGRLVFRRTFRYSLDVFIVAQVIAVALFWVLKFFRYGGATIPLIPIFAFVKLIGTRWFDKLMDEIDEAEIDLVCGESNEAIDLSVPLTEEDGNMRSLHISEALTTLSTFATTTLPSLTFHPHERLPSVPSPSRLATQIHSGGRSRSASKLSNQGAQMDATLLRVGSRNSTNEAKEHLLSSASPPGKSPAPAGATGGRPTALSNRSLVTPHAPVVRDDRPVTHLHYENPATQMPLARALWLIRNPLLPLDLGDTVDYHGRALVSSEGGSGLVGLWEQDKAATVEENGGTFVASSELVKELLLQEIADEGERGSTLRRTESRSVLGTERILVASDVAVRAEAEGVTTGGRRRSSAGVSSILPPSMRRRGTGESSSTRGSVFVTTPQHSPSATLQRRNTPEQVRQLDHPLARDSPPAMPSFVPPTGSAGGSSPVRERPSTLAAPDDYFATPSRRSVSAALPDSESLSPVFSRTRSRSHSQITTRARRSASHATSHLAVTLEGDGTEEAAAEVAITQADALREELLAEAKQEHKMFRSRERARHEKERSDRGESTFRKWFTKEVASAPEA